MAVTRTNVWPFESTRATVSMVVVLVGLLIGGYFSGKRQRKDFTIDESVAYLGVVILVAIPTATFRLFDGQDKTSKAMSRRSSIRRSALPTVCCICSRRTPRGTSSRRCSCSSPSTTSHGSRISPTRASSRTRTEAAEWTDFERRSSSSPSPSWPWRPSWSSARRQCSATPGRRPPRWTCQLQGWESPPSGCSTACCYTPCS